MNSNIFGFIPETGLLAIKNNASGGAGYVTLSTTQTITGQKTFDTDAIFNYNLYTENLIASNNIQGGAMTAGDVYVTNHLVFADGTSQVTAYKSLIPGVYTSCQITVDAHGAISSIVSGSTGTIADYVVTQTMSGASTNYYFTLTNNSMTGIAQTLFQKTSLYYAYSTNTLVANNFSTAGSLGVTTVNASTTNTANLNCTTNATITDASITNNLTATNINGAKFLLDASLNLFAGVSAPLFGTAGAYGNTVYGYQAGKNITSGNYNLCLGYQAGLSDPYVSGPMTGSYNICLGTNSGNYLISGGDNILLGHNAGYHLNGQQRNICIGSYAGSSATLVGDNNIVIGYNAQPALTLEDNAVVLGSTSAINYYFGGASSVYNLPGTINTANITSANITNVTSDLYNPATMTVSGQTGLVFKSNNFTVCSISATPSTYWYNTFWIQNEIRINDTTNNKTSQMYQTNNQLVIYNYTAGGNIFLRNKSADGLSAQGVVLSYSDITMTSSNCPTISGFTTPSISDSSNKIATTSWVQSVVSSSNQTLYLDYTTTTFPYTLPSVLPQFVFIKCNTTATKTITFPTLPNVLYNGIRIEFRKTPNPGNYYGDILFNTASGTCFCDYNNVNPISTIGFNGGYVYASFFSDGTYWYLNTII